jgi:4-hydroxybenzoate polyprenyltransferase
MEKRMKGKIMAWLRLFRIPNWLTVPGDVLVGFWWVTGWQVLPMAAWWAVVGVLGIYVLGLLANDWVDRNEDAVDRPNRPIPAGWIAPRSLLGVAVGLWLVVLLSLAVPGLTSLVFGVVLLTLAIAYSGFFRRWPWAGFLALGVCRALAVAVGASAAGDVSSWPWEVWFYGGAVGIWITAVSALAKVEVGMPAEKLPIPVGFPAICLGVVGVLWLGLADWRSGENQVLGGVLVLWLVVAAWRGGRRFAGDWRERPGVVGSWLGLLLPLQGLMLVPMPRWMDAFVVVVLVLIVWGIRRWLGRYFAAS